MRLRSLLVASGLCLLSTLAQAGVVNIDFENLPAGTNINTQYAGVSFSSNFGWDSNLQPHSTVDVLAFGFPGYGNNASAVWGNTVTLDFASDVSNFSLLMADTESGTLLGIITAYDGNGNQIDQTIANSLGYNTPWFYQQTLALNDSGIRKVTIQTDLDGAVFDNLNYTVADAQAVPEPASMVLLGLGLAAMSLVARRRKA